MDRSERSGGEPSSRPPTEVARSRASTVHGPERDGRHIALAVVFEADFGQRTAQTALERRLAEGDVTERAARHARRVVQAVVDHRDSIDARIEQVAPAYPVVQLARMDRALLRCGMGELLHCPTTPDRVAISEWVELARTYSGEPARRLMNGALGRVAKEATDAQAPGRDSSQTGPEGETAAPSTTGRTEGPGE